MGTKPGKPSLKLRPIKTANISYGEVYLCPLGQNEIRSSKAQPKLIVVLQATSLCENRLFVYGAPLSYCDEGCNEDGLFNFQIDQIDSDGDMSGAVIDLSKIASIPVSELHVKIGQLGCNDMQQLSDKVKKIFGV